MASSLRVCCNALLAAYARAQPTQWPKAIRLLDLMWGCGGELCPDIVSYNTVIKACGNANKVDLGFKVGRKGRGMQEISVLSVLNDRQCANEGAKTDLQTRNDLCHVPLTKWCSATWYRLPTLHT
jgi:hypothetical protein